ncbi:DNA-binding protein [Mucilaginibacter terrigena]|uniref:DNA-binding protein n=1 Tax=Mucilaginibacter terrigena TaxID=2492395 RepID=A0A4V1ZBX7_9SPHI|nr:helix-turn-helix domain-containing protein [Mucilaginibacter terrigena]RYU90700.1 DNA-binding protein [Mucilaginibacter terrigena]
MKNNTVKQIQTRKYYASPRLTHEFKLKLKRDIKWLYVNKEFIEFIEATIKKLPKKDVLPCLYYFKKLAVQVRRTPEPEHYKAFEGLYDEHISEIIDEQKFYNPVKWIDAEIEEIMAVAGLATVNAYGADEDFSEFKPSFDPELVPEKKVIEMLGMSKSKLLRLRAEGMPYQQIGKPIFYNLKELKEWLKCTAA